MKKASDERRREPCAQQLRSVLKSYILEIFHTDNLTVISHRVLLKGSVDLFEHDDIRLELNQMDGYTGTKDTETGYSGSVM